MCLGSPLEQSFSTEILGEKAVFLYFISPYRKRSTQEAGMGELRGNIRLLAWYNFYRERTYNLRDPIGKSLGTMTSVCSHFVDTASTGRTEM